LENRPVPFVDLDVCFAFALDEVPQEASSSDPTTKRNRDARLNMTPLLGLLRINIAELDPMKHIGPFRIRSNPVLAFCASHIQVERALALLGRSVILDPNGLIRPHRKLGYEQRHRHQDEHGTSTAAGETIISPSVGPGSTWSLSSPIHADLMTRSPYFAARYLWVTRARPLKQITMLSSDSIVAMHR
jgi:hypothetical protein